MSHGESKSFHRGLLGGAGVCQWQFHMSEFASLVDSKEHLKAERKAARLVGSKAGRMAGRMAGDN